MLHFLGYVPDRIHKRGRLAQLGERSVRKEMTFLSSIILSITLVLTILSGIDHIRKGIKLVNNEVSA